MPTYKVTVNVRGTETYLVEADNEDEAIVQWASGQLINGETLDVDTDDAVVEET